MTRNIIERTSGSNGAALRGFALTLLVAVLAGGAIEASAQTGDDALRFLQRFPGVTAAQAGMGGTGSAGVANSSAFVTNPAGLGWSDYSWVSGGISTIGVTEDALFNTPGGSFPLENDVSATGLSDLSYVYKLPTRQGSFVAGVGIHQVRSFERSLLFDGENNANSITDFFMPLPGEFTLEQDNQGVFPTFDRTLSFIAFETFAIDLDQGLLDAGDPVPFLPAVSFGTVEQTGFVEEEGRVTEINIGGGVEVAPNVMVGVGLNIPFGTYRFTRIHQELDFRNDNDGMSNGTTDFDYLEFTETFETEMVGINLRTGVSAEVAPGARIGLSVETPTYLALQDNFDTRLRVEFDNGDIYEYGDDRSEDAGSGEFDYEITSPWKVGLGGSFNRSGFTVAADAEWVDWSQMEISADGVSFADENRAIRRGLDAVLNLRLGASYELNDVIFRGGYAMYPDPHDYTLANLDADLPDRDKTFVSAGIGYRFSDKVRIDLGWIRAQFDDEYRPYTEVDGAPVVDEEVSVDRFSLGFTFGF
ncbi:MAG: hypothetical protein HKN17_07120 [Rhodothermales bacterium]|nr:hypothetical protein [Rhodothermales bacterium]